MSADALRELVDRQQIAELLNEYCRALDVMDLDAVAAVFTEDCVVEYGPEERLRSRGAAGVAQSLQRMWRWARTSHHLSNVQIAFTGAKNEAAKAQDLVKRVGASRCFSLAGETTLRQLLVLYSLADVLVTNDSGPAHFAALTPIHTVTLFGPETPLLFAALTPRNLPLWAGIACSPCVSALNNRQSACRDNVCMQRITPDQVFQAVCKSYLARESGKQAA